MHGETEVPQKMEVTPESIRLGMWSRKRAQEQSLMLSYFKPVNKIWSKKPGALPLPTVKTLRLVSYHLKINHL